MAKRKFNESYIQYGFTSIFDNHEEKRNVFYAIKSLVSIHWGHQNWNFIWKRFIQITGIKTWTFLNERNIVWSVSARIQQENSSNIPEALLKRLMQSVLWSRGNVNRTQLERLSLNHVLQKWLELYLKKAKKIAANISFKRYCTAENCWFVWQYKRAGNCRNKKIHNSDYSKFNLMQLPTLPVAHSSWCFADTCQKMT